MGAGRRSGNSAASLRLAPAGEHPAEKALRRRILELRAAAGTPRFAHGLRKGSLPRSELAQGLEDIAGWRGAEAEGPFRHLHHAHGLQRIAAEVEEVVAGPD